MDHAVAIGAFENTLGDKFLGQAKGYASRPRQLSQRVPHDAVFITVMKGAENVHPNPTRGFRTTSQLGVGLPVGRIELE